MSILFTIQSARNVFFVSTFLLIVGIFLIAPRASFASDETRTIISGIVLSITGTTAVVDDGNQKISVSLTGAKITNGVSSNQGAKKTLLASTQKQKSNRAPSKASKEKVQVRVGQRITIVGNEQEPGTVTADRVTVYPVKK
ncbi:MAG: hypothetical protein WCG20_01320 [bacterium]